MKEINLGWEDLVEGTYLSWWGQRKRETAEGRRSKAWARRERAYAKFWVGKDSNVMWVWLWDADLEEFGQVMVKGRKLGAMEGVWSQEVTWGCYCNPGQNDGDWWVAHPSIIETLCRLSDGCGLKISCWWEGGWWGRERKRQRWLGIFVAVCSLGYLIVFWVCLWYSFLS